MKVTLGRREMRCRQESYIRIEKHQDASTWFDPVRYLTNQVKRKKRKLLRYLRRQEGRSRPFKTRNCAP